MQKGSSIQKSGKRISGEPIVHWEGEEKETHAVIKINTGKGGLFASKERQREKRSAQHQGRGAKHGNPAKHQKKGKSIITKPRSTLSQGLPTDFLKKKAGMSLLPKKETAHLRRNRGENQVAKKNSGLTNVRWRQRSTKKVAPTRTIPLLGGPNALRGSFHQKTRVPI